MISRKFNRRKNVGRKSTMLSFLKVSILFLAVLVLLTAVWIAPMLSKAAEVQGKILASNSLTSLMAELLSDEKSSFDGLIEIIKDGQGNILGISTDGQKAVFIQNVFADKVTGMLSDGNGREYSIPLGTLMGGGILAGRGPDIPLKLVPMGYASAELIPEFNTSGINQTTISVYLSITMQYTSMLPMTSSMDSVTERYLVSQTTIVGKVPQYLMQSDSGNSKSDGFYFPVPTQ